MIMASLKPEIGESIADFAHRLAARAPAEGVFNGIHLLSLGRGAAEIVSAYARAMERRLHKRRLSAHGKGGNARDRRKAWRKDVRK